MTIEREADRTVTFECDSCGDTFNTDHEDFRDALDMLKRHNWAIRQIDGNWVHVCPECQEAEIGLAL